MDSTILLLQTSLPALVITVGIIALLVGSFLNVVIYRVPLMLEQEWRHECEEAFGGKDNTKLDPTPFNLITPRSACPHCGHQIKAWENIPVLSYLFLRGKCASCQTPISIQYPLIEVAVALISMLVAWQFGFSGQLLGALLFTWTLVVLSGIDIKSLFLPDNITLPLLWFGIAFNLNGTYVDLYDSVLGAMLGYLSLWSVFHIFRLLTGKEGMGYGDFKLLAAIGAWGGWQILPLVIFVSAFGGAIFGIAYLLLAGKDSQTRIPFGPWLALAGWIALLWGEQLTHFWLSVFIFG